MARRSSRAPLLAAVDMFVCFAAVLFVILGQPQAEVERQVARKQEEIALLDKAIEHRREERRAVEQETRQAQEQEQARVHRAEEETRTRIAQLESEIASTREQLAQRQQEFQNWDVVVDRFRRYSDVSAEPDFHFYLRPNGIYSSQSPQKKWTKEGLKKWLEEISTDGRKPYVVFYIENGANDQVVAVREVVDAINRPDQRVIMSTVTLPSGVVAGQGTHLTGGTP